MKVLFEIGSYEGLTSLKLHKQNYKVYTFEPKKDLYDSLVSKTAHLKNYNIYNKAVCLNDGITKLNICKVGGASSILQFKTNEELAIHWTKNRTDIQYSGVSYDVETTRLDTFIEQNNLNNLIIDYIHINAQGVDLDVLKSLGVYIKNVKEGVIKTFKNQDKNIYIDINNNIYSNVETFLESNNFDIINVKNNDNTNCEFNVYFKREIQKPKNLIPKINCAIIFFGRIKHYEKKYLLNKLSKNNTYDIYYSASNENNIEDFKKIYNITNNNNICNDAILHNYNFKQDYAKPTNINNMICHFINLKRAFNLLINSNIKYDFIIATRLDLEITKSIDIKNDMINSKNTIYIPQGCDYTGINDRFAMGDFDTMKKYCDIIDNCEYLCNNKLAVAHPETLTLSNLIYYKINIIRFDLGSNNIVR